MSRQHFITYLFDYLSGDIGLDDRAKIEAYLKDNPEDRQLLEQEKALSNILSEIETPNPGDSYWEDISGNILDRIQPDNPAPSISERQSSINISTITGYLVPLAASLILFIGSLSFTEFSEPQDQQFAYLDASTETDIDRNNDYYEQMSLELEMIGSTVLGPPGSFGRKLAIFQAVGGTY